MIRPLAGITGVRRHAALPPGAEDAGMHEVDPAGTVQLVQMSMAAGIRVYPARS